MDDATIDTGTALIVVPTGDDALTAFTKPYGEVIGKLVEKVQNKADDFLRIAMTADTEAGREAIKSFAAVKGEPEPPATLDPAQSIALRSAMADIGMRASSLLTWAKIAFDPGKPEAELIPLIDILPAEKFGKAMAIINQKKATKEAEAKTKSARK